MGNYVIARVGNYVMLALRNYLILAGLRLGNCLIADNSVTIPTRNVERAKAFYNGILALPSKPGSPDEFETGNVTLGLWLPEAEGLPFEPATAGIALRVRDVHKARARLEATGVRFEGTEDTGVCHMAFFHDPDGNLLILHHRYAPPQQTAEHGGPGPEEP